MAISIHRLHSQCGVYTWRIFSLNCVLVGFLFLLFWMIYFPKLYISDSPQSNYTAWWGLLRMCFLGTGVTLIFEEGLWSPWRNIITSSWFYQKNTRVFHNCPVKYWDHPVAFFHITRSDSSRTNVIHFGFICVICFFICDQYFLIVSSPVNCIHSIGQLHLHTINSLPTSNPNKFYSKSIP